VSKEKSEVHVGKGQTFEMAGLSKVALSIVHGFDAASTNVLVTSMATSGAVVKTRVAPAVATDTGGHEKWIPVRVVVLRASALGLTLFCSIFFFFFRSFVFSVTAQSHRKAVCRESEQRRRAHGTLLCQGRPESEEGA